MRTLMLDFLPKVLFMKSCRKSDELREVSIIEEKALTLVDQLEIMNFQLLVDLVD